MAKTVMFLGAHADDMEIRAGGAMQHFAARGYRCVSVMMTNNICGAYVDDTGEDYFTTDALATQAIRHREAEAAAALLGMEIIYLDFKENSYFNGTRRVFFGEPAYDAGDPPGREPLIVAQYLSQCIGDVAQVLADHAPEIVITHSVGNCNAEHCAAGHLAHSAFQEARHRAPLQELWFDTRVQSSSDLLHLDPDVLIDITPYRDQKVQALEAHRSQRIPFDRVENTDRYWGRVAGTTFAEGFRTVVRVV